MTAPPWLCERPIAHRGLHDNAGGVPENSSLAFKACLQAGVPIELDVRLSSDGVPMVLHDDDLRRACGVDGLVAASSASALRRLPLFGSAATIPTLAETLEQVGGRVPLLIELKTDAQPGGVEAAVAGLLAGYGGACAVQSFNPRSVRWFAERAPTVIRGQLVGALAEAGDLGLIKRTMLHVMLANVTTRPDFLAVGLRALTPLYAAYVQRLSRCVLAWTVRSEAERAFCASRGFNVIYERPPATSDLMASP